VFQPTAQNLSVIRWQTPVDLAPQYSGNDLLIHYGEPLITSANTVLVPVKTGATDGFEVNAYNGANGAFMYTLSTDYTLPSHNWTPSYAPALVTTPSENRLYYAGAGGTIYYIDNPDSGPGTPVHQVFYTSLSNYLNNASAYNSTIFINTPITSDSNGNIFFGFRVQGTAPAPLSTTQSGFARIDPNGNGSYVLVGTAANDSNIARDSHNSAPAVSNDGTTLYVLVKSASTSYYGYLLGLDTTTLATRSRVFLRDPRPGVGNAGITDDSTASPMVAPDGTVFVGVFAPNYDGSRGWMLHFSGDLGTQYAPAAFGWDDTDAIVPTSMVPQYTGTSPFLIFTKYNNYSSTETGSTGGDGVNMVAILDPYSTETDPRNDGSSPIQVMREVLTVPGPTPDPGNISSSTPHAVREWCINTAAVDPALGAIFFPSEDGNLYQWCPDDNTLMQTINLGTGIGEAYVPTAIGPDGTVYSINNATLFAVGNQTNQTVSVMSSAANLQSAVAGQSITFTATVVDTSGAGRMPTGTITFKDGSLVLGTVTLDSTGHATYTTSTLSSDNSTYPWAGHFISAVYSGDSSFSPGTAILVQSVHLSGTTTTVTSSPNPSTFGSSVTFTATVTPTVSGQGAVTGLVTFMEGTNVLGAAGVNSSGVATLTTSALGVGSHTITAVYYSDLVYATSSGNDSANPQVVQDGTTTTVSTAPNPSVSGQSVTVTALVTSQGTGAGTPTGTVTFTEGSTVLASAVPVDATGHAAFSISTLAVGSHTITGTFTGTTGWLTSSGNNGTSPLVVNKASTTTTVASSANPSVSGQSVTFIATVTVNAPGSQAAANPTGTVTFYDAGVSIGTGTLSNTATDTATFTTSTLSTATHTITAAYTSGDGNFNPSPASTSISEVVNKANTTTTVASSTNPSVEGQSVTFTATVSVSSPGSNAAANPTGTVTFYDGGAAIGTGTLSNTATDTATFTTSTLSAGAHAITAAYIGGDANFNASPASASITQNVNKANTTTSVASSVNPSVYGQSISFTATVTVNAPGSQAGANPTGTVTFYDGGVAIGTGMLSNTATDTATFTTSALSTATHTITAAYTSGDANFNASAASASITQTVGQANTATTLTSSPNPSVYGQTVTFTAVVTAVAPGSGIPTGTVTFKGAKGVVLGTVAVNGMGQATLSISTIAAGSTTVTATYNGDGNFSTSSGTTTQVVNKASTATALTSSLNPSIYGQNVTFTATVTATSGGTPTGSVTFKDGTTTLGTSTLNSGVASFTISTLAVGTHPITAAYSGSSNFNPSTSSVLTQTVNSALASSSTAVVSSVNPSVFGESVTFTATVSPVPPATGTPTGTVTFSDGANSLGTVTLSNGMASFSISSLSATSHTITASYSGDANFSPSSGSMTQTVAMANSMTAIASSANPSVSGQSVTFTATVTAVSPGAGTPTGTVTFLDGTSTLGAVALSGGVASLTTSSLTVAGHTVTASYNGDSNFNTSSGNLTQTVTVANSATAIASSINPSAVGQSVTFTATVSPVSPGSGTPTGTVTFLDGTSTLGTATLSSGTASFTTSALNAGNHTISASYGGDTNFAGSSASLTQTVGQSSLSTTTTITSATNPSAFGQSVTFTATVSSNSGSGSPTGTVTFDDGSTILGTSTLSSGTATFSTSALVAGSHSITAIYSGDGTFTGSTSTPLTQVVNPDATSTSVISSPNPSSFGQAVTITAIVTAVAPGSGVPTGTVTFLIDKTVLATVTLDSTGQATFSTSTLAVGSTTLTASYSGDSNFLTSSGTTTQVVNMASTTTSLTSSPNPSTTGQRVTFTATVTSSSGAIPGGSVTFYDGTTSLGTSKLNGSGVATLAVAFYTLGSHQITAVYGGSTNFTGSTSPVLIQNVVRILVHEPASGGSLPSGNPGNKGNVPAPWLKTKGMTSINTAILDQFFHWLQAPATAEQWDLLKLNWSTEFSLRDFQGREAIWQALVS
jgi:hypothetical protein